MSPVVEALAFDSELFGLPIGRVRGPVAEHDLVRAREEAAHFELLYLAGARLEDLPLGAIPGRVGVVDLRLDLARAPSAPAMPPSVSPLGTGETPAVAAAQAIAAEVFTASRFFREPRLAPKAPALYRIWVEKLLGTGSGDSGARAGVLVARSEGAAGSVDGFLAYRADGDAQRIDLIGVGESGRGHGAGTALMTALAARFPDHPIVVRVSADNVSALDFYLRSGFRPRASDVIVHLWRAP